MRTEDPPWRCCRLREARAPDPERRRGGNDRRPCGDRSQEYSYDDEPSVEEELDDYSGSEYTDVDDAGSFVGEVEDETHGSGVVCSILLVFADSVFGISCSAYCNVKGAAFTSIPMESNDSVHLIDNSRWGVVRSLLPDKQYDAVFFTPPTNTFHDMGTEFRPAFRGGCERSWFGADGIPTSMQNQTKEDNLIWQRVGEVCV